MAITYVQKTNPNPLASRPSPTLPKGLQQSFGTGLEVPLTCIDNVWQTRTEVDKLKQDIAVLIFTPVGRRFMELDFGSLVPYRTFNREDTTLGKQLEIDIINAINTKMSNKITVISVTPDYTNINTNQILLNVIYQANGTTARSSVALPFDTSDQNPLPPGSFILNGKSVFFIIRVVYGQ